MTNTRTTREDKMKRDSIVRGHDMNDFITVNAYGETVILWRGDGSSVCLTAWPGDGLIQRVLAFGPHRREV